MFSNPPKLFAIAAVVAAALTFLVRSRYEDEVQSVLTGLTVVGPFLAAAGMVWSDGLDERGLLGPKVKWSIPDLEQILEGLAVLFAALVTYWLLLNGPSVDNADPGRLNSLANSLRNFRAEEGARTTNLVPSGTSWYVIGAILSGPFWFSFGSMIARETIGRAKRKANVPEMSVLEAGSDLGQLES